MNPFCVLTITAPAGAGAKKIAQAILKKRFAACVNIIPAVQSIYWWKGRMEQTRESLLIVKTKKALSGKLILFIQKIHPYEVPEILVLPVVAGFKPYLAWLKKETA